MTRSQVVSRLSPLRDELADRFGVRRLSLFGSVARGEETDASDIDLLVDFDRDVGLFTLFTLQDELESRLGCRVDLGTPGSLKPAVRDSVLAETVDVLSTGR